MSFLHATQAVMRETGQQLYVAGVPTNVFEWHTAHGVDSPVGSCTFTVPLPLADHIVHGAFVEVTGFQRSVSDYNSNKVFRGVLRDIQKEQSETGQYATCKADDFAYLLTFPLLEDIAISTGGVAEATVDVLLGTSHIGDNTYAHYTDASPAGSDVNLGSLAISGQPSFVVVSGRAHGCNTMADDNTLLNTKSRIVIKRAGNVIGSAPLPVLPEQLADALDYDDDANWSDFSVTVYGNFTNATHTVHAVSGTGTGIGDNTYDDFEVKQVTASAGGPIKLREVIRAIFGLYGFGGSGGYAIGIEDMVDANGDDIYIGGNPLVDDGQIRLPAGTVPLDYIAQLCALFGYRVFGCPDGKVRIRRVSGEPATSVATYTEGQHFFDLKAFSDARPIVNYWVVEGASGTDASGNEFAYADGPDSIPANDYIPNPPGAVRGELSSDILVSNELCEIVRNLQEIDFSSLYERAEWSWRFLPQLSPGQPVTITAPTFDMTARKMWVTSVAHDMTEAGIYTTLSAWVGTGTALPSGNDCTDVAVLTDSIHVGNRTVANYDNPTPDGTTVSVNFYLDEDFSDAVLAFRAHGCNTWVFRNMDPEDVTPSYVEVWQFDVKLGDSVLPMINDYSGVSYSSHWLPWAEVALDLPFALRAGKVTLKFVSGNDPTFVSEPRDEYEVGDIVLTACGIGIPMLPVTPTEPVIVPPKAGVANTLAVSASPSGAVSFGVNQNAGGFTIPAGTQYVRMSAIFSGMTGSTACFTGECQVVRWFTNGGWQAIYTPNSQSAAGVSDGVMLVGSGRGEYVWNFGSGILTPMVIAPSDIIFQAFESGHAFSYTGLLWEAFTPAQGDPIA